MRLLLRVGDRFELRGRGLVLTPGLPPGSATAGRLRVRLRRPDGAEREALASIELNHFNAPSLPVEQRWQAMICLHDATSEEVPIGTEVWRDESS